MLFSASIRESSIYKEHQWIKNSWVTQLLWISVEGVLRSKEYSFAILFQMPRSIAEDKAGKNASSKRERKVCKNAFSFASYSRENKKFKVVLLTSLCLKKKWAPLQSSKVGERIQGPVPQIVGPNNTLLLQVASFIVHDHIVEKESI